MLRYFATGPDLPVRADDSVDGAFKSYRMRIILTITLAYAISYTCRRCKTSHGERFAVVDGGLHHQLAASGNFGTVIRRNYPIAIATKFDRPTSGEAISIVGCLCTPLDRLGDKVMLPPVEGCE